VSTFFKVLALARGDAGIGSEVTTGSETFGASLTGSGAGSIAASFTTVGTASTTAGVEATAAEAGSPIATVLPFGAACSTPACARWNVTRVRRVPISVTSSAAIDVIDGGRLDGMVSVDAFDAPVRSMTNRS